MSLDVTDSRCEDFLSPVLGSKLSAARRVAPRVRTEIMHHINSLNMRFQSSYRLWNHEERTHNFNVLRIQNAF